MSEPPRNLPSDEGRFPTPTSGDPYAIIAYLLSGMVLYGGIGWALDRWLGTTFLVAVGLLIGATLSLIVVYLRFGRPQP